MTRRDYRVELPAGWFPGFERRYFDRQAGARAKSAIRASGSTPSTVQPAAWNWRPAIPVRRVSGRRFFDFHGGDFEFKGDLVRDKDPARVKSRIPCEAEVLPVNPA
jgi:hypothetical protein